MRRLLTRATAALLLLLVVGAGVSQAQSSRIVKAEIPFVFFAGTKEMPAGTYRLEKQFGGPVTISGPSGASAVLAVMTYLGRHDSDAEPELVFDKLEGKMQLSEVWYPGEDGLLLHGTKERHDHAIVGGPKAKK